MHEKLARAWNTLGDAAPRLLAQYFEQLCRDCKLSEAGDEGVKLAAAFASEVVGCMAQGYEVDGVAGRPVLRKPGNESFEVVLYADPQ